MRCHFSFFVLTSASRAAREGRPAATASEQEAGAHGRLGPDPDPHHGAAVPADVKQSECGGPRGFLGLYHRQAPRGRAEWMAQGAPGGESRSVCSSVGGSAGAPGL